MKTKIVKNQNRERKNEVKNVLGLGTYVLQRNILWLGIGSNPYNKKTTIICVFFILKFASKILFFIFLRTKIQLERRRRRTYLYNKIVIIIRIVF